MIIYMKDIECIRFRLTFFCSKKYANRNQSERFKSTRSALNLASINNGNFGMYKEATDILAKKPWQSVPRARFLLCCKLRTEKHVRLYLVYEKRKYAVTKNIEIHHSTVFPKQSRQHLIIQAEITQAGQSDQSLQRLLAIFPFLFLRPR
jgi:hypothetical protein